MDKLLTDTEVMKIIGGKSKLVTYPELMEFSKIDDLFGDSDKIILLYVNEMNGNSVVGHWCLLTKVKKGKRTEIEFTDPYGFMPDEQIKFYDTQWKNESGQNRNALTKLLYDFSLNPKNSVFYNELKVQKDNENINTCGRHIGLRGHFYKVPLKKYQQIFKNLKKNGNDLDEIIVELTNKLL